MCQDREFSRYRQIFVVVVVVFVFVFVVLLLSWMFAHDCLHTCCFESYVHAFCIFCICTCSAQLSMFHMERAL